MSETHFKDKPNDLLVEKKGVYACTYLKNSNTNWELTFVKLTQIMNPVLLKIENKNKNVIVGVVYRANTPLIISLKILNLFIERLIQRISMSIYWVILTLIYWKPTYIDLSMNMLILFTLFPCFPLFTNPRESQLLQLLVLTIFWQIMIT